MTKIELKVSEPETPDDRGYERWKTKVDLVIEVGDIKAEEITKAIMLLLAEEKP